jgi:hypothetical protein
MTACIFSDMVKSIVNLLLCLNALRPVKNGFAASQNLFR